MKIHTLTIEHRHGRQVSAHATRADADAALAAYVRERAGEIVALDGALDDMDEAEAVDEFYRLVDDESADIEECELALPVDHGEAVARLRQAVDSWPQFDVESGPLRPGTQPDEDSSVNGGDMVEWFGEWRASVKALLGAGHVIRSFEAPGLYWSNSQGWVALADATRFTEAETATLRLPIGGEWAER